jgi:hypothetical protein
LNGLIIRMSHKHVFASEESEAIKMLVSQNNKFSYPLPDFSDVRANVAKKYGMPSDALD